MAKWIFIEDQWINLDRAMNIRKEHDSQRDRDYLVVKFPKGEFCTIRLSWADFYEICATATNVPQE